MGLPAPPIFAPRHAMRLGTGSRRSYTWIRRTRQLLRGRTDSLHNFRRGAFRFVYEGYTHWLASLFRCGARSDFAFHPSRGTIPGSVVILRNRPDRLH